MDNRIGLPAIVAMIRHYEFNMVAFVGVHIQHCLFDCIKLSEVFPLRHIPIFTQEKCVHPDKFKT